MYVSLSFSPSLPLSLKINTNLKKKNIGVLWDSPITKFEVISKRKKLPEKPRIQQQGMSENYGTGALRRLRRHSVRIKSVKTHSTENAYHIWC